MTTRVSSIRHALRTRGPLLAVSAIAFAIAARSASEAAASPNNCGELPGIAVMANLTLGFAVAGGLVVLGGILAVVTKGAVGCGVPVAVGLAIAGGLVVGVAATPANRCGSDQPQPTRQVGTLVLTMIEPYPGLRLQGPIECRRPAPGANVSEIVTEGGRADAVWTVSAAPITYVGIEVWPFGDSVYRPADYLRVLLNQPAAASDAGASSFYSDGHGDVLRVRTADDGSSGSIGFVDLPLWSGERFGTGLPDTISGTLTWACTGEER